MVITDSHVLSIADAMAQVFTSPEVADRVLRAIGLPRERTPVFARFSTPLDYWSHTCDELAKGAVLDGLRLLCAEAVRLYPDSAAARSLLGLDAKDSLRGTTDYSRRYVAVQQYLDGVDPEHRNLVELYRAHKLPHYLKQNDAYRDEHRSLAAEYFKLLGEALEHADKADRSIRLDVYLFVMDASLGELRCQFLFDQLQLAAATPGFHRAHADPLARVLAGMERCVLAHLDEHTLPPFAEPRLRKRLRAAWVQAADTPELLLDAQQSLLRILWVTRLIDGSEYPEKPLVAAIERALRTTRAIGLSSRVVALLHYRRCLAHVYLGQWRELSAELAGTVTYLDGWDLNWTAFLHLQLGRITKSVELYEQAIKSPEDDVRAVATYGLLGLLPATHSPFVVRDKEYFPAFEAELARRAALERQIAQHAQTVHGRRRGLGREQRLEFVVEASDRMLRVAARRALEESGRGFSIGDSGSLTVVMREFQRHWLQGIPPVNLRQEQIADTIKFALRDQPLSTVLEFNLVADVLHRWEPKDLREAAEMFVRGSSLTAWQDLLTDQAARLQRLVEFFFSERRIGFGPTCAREERQFDQIFRRIRCGISFFAGLEGCLPNRILLPLGRICAQLIRFWSIYWVLSREERQGWYALTWLAIRRTGQTPEQMGIDPRHVADILKGRLDGNPGFITEWLNDRSHRLSPRYRRAFESAQTQPSSRRRSCPIELGDVDTTILSRRALLDEMLAHWCQWRENGLNEPFFDVAAPPSDEDEQHYYTSIVRPTIDALARRLRAEKFHPLTLRWLSRGIYGLSELALRFVDIDRWLLLFEVSPVWIGPWDNFDCSLHVVRAACERSDTGPALRARIYQGIAVSRVSDDWFYLAVTFESLLRAARSIHAEDVAILRLLSARAHHPRESLLVLRAYIKVLQTLESSSLDPPLAEALARSLDGLPEWIVAFGLLPVDTVELVSRFIAALDALPRATQQQLGEQYWRPTFDRLKVWLDGHAYGALGRERLPQDRASLTADPPDVSSPAAAPGEEARHSPADA